MSFLGVPLRYRLTFELEPARAMHHSDARKAADRVAAAIEQLESESPDLEGLQLVKIVATQVVECRSADDCCPTMRGRSA